MGVRKTHLFFTIEFSNPLPYLSEDSKALSLVKYVHHLACGLANKTPKIGSLLFPFTTLHSLYWNWFYLPLSDTIDCYARGTPQLYPWEILRYLLREDLFYCMNT